MTCEEQFHRKWEREENTFSCLQTGYVAAFIHGEHIEFKSESEIFEFCSTLSVKEDLLEISNWYYFIQCTPRPFRETDTPYHLRDCNIFKFPLTALRPLIFLEQRAFRLPSRQIVIAAEQKTVDSHLYHSFKESENSEVVPVSDLPALEGDLEVICEEDYVQEMTREVVPDLSAPALPVQPLHRTDPETYVNCDRRCDYDLVNYPTRYHEIREIFESWPRNIEVVCVNDGSNAARDALRDLKIPAWSADPFSNNCDSRDNSALVREHPRAAIFSSHSEQFSPERYEGRLIISYERLEYPETPDFVYVSPRRLVRASREISRFLTDPKIPFARTEHRPLLKSLHALGIVRIEVEDISLMRYASYMKVSLEIVSRLPEIESMARRLGHRVSKGRGEVTTICHLPERLPSSGTVYFPPLDFVGDVSEIVRYSEYKRGTVLKVEGHITCLDGTAQVTHRSGWGYAITQDAVSSLRISTICGSFRLQQGESIKRKFLPNPVVTPMTLPAISDARSRKNKRRKKVDIHDRGDPSPERRSRPRTRSGPRNRSHIADD